MKNKIINCFIFIICILMSFLVMYFYGQYKYPSYKNSSFTKEAYVLSKIQSDEYTSNIDDYTDINNKNIKNLPFIDKIIVGDKDTIVVSNINLIECIHLHKNLSHDYYIYINGIDTSEIIKLDDVKKACDRMNFNPQNSHFIITMILYKINS